MNPIKTVKNLLWKRKILDVQRFAQAHRRYLVIVADPKDDSIFVAHRGKQVTGKIRSADGFNHEIVKRVLKHSTFHSSIDRFLGSLIDVLKTPIEQGNNFYQFIDGALFNISKALRKSK